MHPKFHTPHVVTIITGVAVSLFAAMFPVGALADISNSGTLFAFLMVAVGVMILRKTPARPAASVPHADGLGRRSAGDGRLRRCCSSACRLYTIQLFLDWAVIGIAVYFLYSRKRSHLANGTQHD